MNENDRRILTKACGLCWHEWGQDKNDPEEAFPVCQKCNCRRYHVPDNPTFTTADDWELVRVRVVVPNQEAFCEYLDKHGVWMIIWFSLSSEDRNKISVDFIKAHPNRFPWVVEMEGR